MMCVAGEPAKVEDALGDLRWKQAMDEEYSALMRNKTWHLVPAQRGKNIIDLIVSGCTELKRRQMAQLTGTRHG
jgi:hypothetical protein